MNWDHGALGVQGAWAADEGILDVTLPPFSADNTGAADATLALQSALDFARHNYLSVWLPVGEYRVSQSLRALQHPRQSSNGFAGLNLSANFCFNRYSSWTIRGEVLRSDLHNPAPPAGGGRGRPGRATLVLPPDTPAFALTEGSETPPLAVLNVSSVNSHFELEPNVLMNTIVQSIDATALPTIPLAPSVLELLAGTKQWCGPERDWLHHHLHTLASRCSLRCVAVETQHVIVLPAAAAC